MNTVGSLIATTDSDYLLLNKKDQTRLSTAVILYVFRAIESTELTEIFKSSLNWTGQQCINFRQVLKGKGYIQKNLKFFIYAKYSGSHLKANDFQIVPADVLLVTKLRLSKTPLAKKLVATCLRYKKLGYKVRTLNEFDSGLNKVMPELREGAGKFVSVKFKFLTQSGQLHKEDLVQEFQFYALYAQYRAYPEIDDLLQLKNIGQTAIHNRGINIIKEQTSQSRKRLVKNEDGTFSGLLKSMHSTDFDTVFSQDAGSGFGGAMIVCNALMTGLDGTCVEHERPSDVDRARDLKRDVENLFLKMKTERARLFASLLMGLHDSGFSTYLGCPNDEASDVMDLKDYVKAARTYLKIPKERASAFARNLRKELREYRH